MDLHHLRLLFLKLLNIVIICSLLLSPVSATVQAGAETDQEASPQPVLQEPDGDEPERDFYLYFPLVSMQRPPAPELAIGMAHDVEFTYPGGQIQYILSHENIGKRNAVGVYVLEEVSEWVWVDLESGCNQGWDEVAARIYRYDVGELAAEGGGEVSFCVTVSEQADESATEIINRAEIRFGEPGTHDVNPDNDRAQDVVPLFFPPDLSVIGSASVSQAEPGGTVVFTLDYANQSDHPAAEVFLRASLPANAVFSATGSTTGWVDEGDGVYAFSLGDLAPGVEGQVDFGIVLDAVFPAGVEYIAHQVSISDNGAHGPDANPDDNQSSLNLPVDAVPDLRLSQVDGEAIATPGNVVVYTLTVQNAGNQDASGVEVTTTLPGNTVFVPAESTTGWQAGSSVGGYVYQVGELSSGGSQELVFAVQLDELLPTGLDQIVSNAQVSDDASGGADPNPDDNVAEETTPVDAVPDLSIEIEGAPAAALPEGTLVYTLSYLNHGAQGATGVTLTTTLPGSTAFNAAQSSAGWSRVGSTDQYTYTVGALAAGSSGEAVFAVDVDAAIPAGLETLENTAAIVDDGTNGADATASDNTASIESTLEAAPDLALSLSDGDAATVPGGLIRYTLSYANHGNQDATGVWIVETLPANTTFNAAQSDPCWQEAVEPGQYTCAIGALSAGQSGEVVFAVNATAVWPEGVSEVSNEATLADDGAGGEDPTPLDNSDSDITIVHTEPELAINLEVDKAFALAGELVVFTLNYTNNGYHDASGVTLTETLPDWTSFDAANSSAGWQAVGGDVYTYLVGDFPSGASGSVAFAVRVAETLDPNDRVVENTASIVDDGVHGADPISENNTDTVQFSVALGYTEVSGTLSEDTVWTLANTPYKVNATVTVPAGISLAVEPGVIVKFSGTSVGLVVYGALDAQGGDEVSIIFTSIKDDESGGDGNRDGDATQPSAGDWRGIEVYSGGAALLDYTKVLYSGYNGSYKDSAVYVQNGASLTVTHSEIGYSGYYGISADGNETPVITDNEIHHCGSTAVRVVNDSDGIPLQPQIHRNQIHDNGSSAIYLSGYFLTGNRTITGNSGANNAYNRIFVGSDVEGVTTFSADNSFAYWFSGVDVPVGDTLNLDAGTVIKFQGGQMTLQGTLNANATAEQPVVFTSYRDDAYGGDSNGDGGATLPTKGDWYGLTVPAGGTAVLNRVVLQYAGNTSSTFDALVNVDNGGSLSLNHARLAYSNQYGVRVNGVEDQELIGNTISNCDSYGIYFIDDSDNLPAAPVIQNNVLNNNNYAIYISGQYLTGERTITGNTGTGNTRNAIYLNLDFYGSAALSADNGLFWYFGSAVDIPAGQSLTLDPGAVVKFNGSALAVSGTLHAVGTVETPITFTSINDIEGGTPAKGDWDGIIVRGTGTAVLEHIIVRYGGHFITAYSPYVEALVTVLEGGNLTLTNSRLEHSEYKGVEVRGVEEQSLIGNTIEDCNSYGIYIYDNDEDTLPVNPEIRDNVINNTSTPIYIQSGDGYTGDHRITGNTGVSNTYNYIYMPYTIYGNSAFGPDNGLDWRFYSITMPEGASLTLDPNTVLKITEVIYVSGTLTADATAGNEVVFTSLDDQEYGGVTGDGVPEKGDWIGIIVRETGTAVLDHVIVRYGGDFTTAYSPYLKALVTVLEGGNLTLTNSKLEHSSSYGVEVRGVEEQSLIGNTIEDCNSYGIYINDLDEDTIPVNPELRDNVINNTNRPIYMAFGDGYTGDHRITGNTGVSNTYNYISMPYSTVFYGNSAFGPDNGLDWGINSITIAEGASLTLDPNTVLKITEVIYVSGTLTADATAGNEVVFTSLDDQAYGGATGDGVPEKGDWIGVIVRETGTAVLDHVIVRYGGDFTTAYSPYLHALVAVVEGGRLTLTNSRLEHSSREGVEVRGVNHYISGNSFWDIDSYAVYNGDTENIYVRAENNWWGDDSGPAPFGAGEGINYRTCIDSKTRARYICEYYVDANPWIGKSYNDRTQYGQNVAWQYYDADPVNTANGNYAYNQTDVAIPVKGDFDFDFSRSYNSLDPFTSTSMGYGWQHSYIVNLVEQTEQVTVNYGDGRQARFELVEGVYQSPAGNYDVLTKEVDNTFRIHRKDNSVMVFDLLGRLASMVDRNGHTITLNYIGNRLSTIVGPAGRMLLTLSYTDDKLTQIQDVLGRLVSYEYDTEGDLVSVVDAENHTTTFTYDENHRLLTITDANGHTYLTNAYDEVGRVAKQWDAEGYTTEFFYNALDHDTYVTDRRGFTTLYDYDDQGRLVESTDALGNTTSYTYDADFNIITVVDPRDFSTSYTYDERGNQLTATDALDGVSSMVYNEMNLPLTVTDAKGQNTSYTYDTAGNRLTQQDPTGYIYTYSYYTVAGYRGLLHTSADPLNHTTTYTYNANGDLTQVTNAIGYSQTFSYDEAGRKLNETNARGYTTSYTYDQLNRPLTVTDSLNGIISNTYDAVGNKVSQMDANGKSTLYTYTDRDKLLSITDPAGYVTTNDYDAAENLVSVTDGNGHSTAYTYDALNRMSTEADADGNILTYTYDANGNVTGVKDGLNHTITTVYDGLNRPVSVQDALSHNTEYTYDAVGNKLSVTDANGHTTSYAYNERNQMTSVTDAMDGVVTYGYDAVGNRVSVLDANNHTTSYTYDAMNRLSAINDPLSHTQSQTYDANGNKSVVTNANGGTITYAYDELDRLTTVQYSDGNQVSYTYDAVGNRLEMTDSTGATNYIYDNLYRPVTISSPSGTVSYTYDAKNRLTVTTSAGTTTYSYSNADDLNSVTDWENNITQYTYDAAGRLATTTLPNGIITTNSYDAADRLTGVTHKLDTTTLESFTYTLDNVGNRLSMTDADGTTSYVYDALDRLTSVTYPTGAPAVVTYSYDAMGNRLSLTQDGVTTSYTYDAADRLTVKTTQGITTNYAWDNAGNLLSKGDQSYVWNVAGKMMEWSNGSDTMAYQYNGDGVRTAYTVNGTNTSYLQDLAAGMAVVLRETTAGQTTDYIYGNDLIAQMDTGGNDYLLTDGLGSTRLVSDAVGNVTGRYAYDAFGAERTHTGAGSTDFTFTGEQMDPETGLQYLRARYYDFEDGRFISVDPLPRSLSSTQKGHSYVYVENNPTGKIDPLGMSSQEMRNCGSIMGASSITSGFGGGLDWEVPDYYKVLKVILKKSKIKIEGETVLNLPKMLKGLKIGGKDFWKYYGTASKTFGYIDDGIGFAEDYNTYQYNQRTGAYGKTQEAQNENLSKYVSTMRAWEIFTSWIPGKYFPAGNQMDKQKTFSNFTDRYAKRTGSQIDMAVIDPSKDPEGFLDALDRYNATR